MLSLIPRQPQKISTERIRQFLEGRGYDVTLVTDAHTTSDLTQWGAPPPEQVIDHTNLYWQYQTAPGRTAAAVAADEVWLGAGQS